VRTRGQSILIDTSTDLWHQARREKIPRVDAVLYTHPHSDHVSGIDELRAYNYIQQESIPVWGNAWTCRDLPARYPYIFSGHPGEGGGVAQLRLHEFSGAADRIDVLGIPVIPLSLKHGSRECVGYRIDSIAYVTDCSYIPPETLERMKGLSVLILDCLRIRPHGTHFHLDQALEVVSQVRPKRTFLTHLGHDFDYAKTNRMLPKGVSLAYDGLKIRVNK
jgi:phosphoribosyl 1,2-cyclic phosphate phosphodiesterase